jgi:carbon monoxide dehydrogenase subunit G
LSLTITSSFYLEAPLQDAWNAITNIERAAPCFPGTQLIGQNPDGSWKANFLVKLGPMAFSFAGRFQIAEANTAEGLVLVKAQGSDTKGRGGASATVKAQLLAEERRTKVDLVSAVDLSGGVAQFGRGAGMIEALSRQLVNQFASNLQAALLSAPVGVADEGGPAPAPVPAPPQAIDGMALVWSVLRAKLGAWRDWALGRSRSDGSK